MHTVCLLAMLGGPGWTQEPAGRYWAILIWVENYRCAHRPYTSEDVFQLAQTLRQAGSYGPTRCWKWLTPTQWPGSSRSRKTSSGNCPAG